MMIRYFLSVLLLVTLISCKKKETEPEPEYKYVPTDVIFKTTAQFSINQLFDLINELNHEVEVIRGGVLISDFQPDSLQYVLDFINKKPYTGTNDWKVSGYNHYETKVITVFPRLHQINNRANQQDWLQTMQLLQLKEIKEPASDRGYIVHIHVHEGKEKEWVATLRTYNFIQWAELNYIIPYILHH